MVAAGSWPCSHTQRRAVSQILYRCLAKEVVYLADDARSFPPVTRPLESFTKYTLGTFLLACRLASGGLGISAPTMLHIKLGQEKQLRGRPVYR